MAINIHPKASTQLPNYLILFLIHSNQVGVGILGFQRIIAKEAGHDAWIAVILGGLLAHITMFVIVRTLRRYPSADIYGIQFDLYGKYLGSLFNWIYILYFMWSATIVLRTYIEIIQTWVFPETSTWAFSAVFLLMVMYTVFGGIRVIAGYTFITVCLTIFLLGTVYFPLQYTKEVYLYPIFSNSLEELWKGALAMSLTLSGFEILYVLYPFAKEKARIGKFAQSALLFTNVLYLIFMLVAQVFFSHDQLMKTIWASLTMEKMVHFSFLERFEYIAISVWLFVIMPNLMLFSWCASRGVKRMYGWNQRKILIIMLLVVFIASLIPDTRQQVDKMNDLFSKASRYLVFLYPYLLYGLVVIKQLWKKGRGQGTHEQTNETSSG